MNRHRKLLLTVGIVQLAAAGILFMFWFGANIKGVEHRSAETATSITGGLRAAGVDVPSIEREGGLDAHEAIRQPVRSEIYASESRAWPSILAVGFFGVMALIAGLIPERRRPLPPAEA
ncbi:MAG: hypothetical protein RIB58_02115 [Phycisphaerales bacterium]